VEEQIAPCIPSRAPGRPPAPKLTPNGPYKGVGGAQKRRGGGGAGLSKKW